MEEKGFLQLLRIAPSLLQMSLIKSVQVQSVLIFNYSVKGKIKHTEKNAMSLFVSFIDVIIQQANWDASKTKEKFRRDMETHVASVRAAKLSELTASYEVSYPSFSLRCYFHLGDFKVPRDKEYFSNLTAYDVESCICRKACTRHCQDLLKLFWMERMMKHGYQ